MSNPLAHGMSLARRPSLPPAAWARSSSAFDIVYRHAEQDLLWHLGPLASASATGHGGALADQQTHVESIAGLGHPG